MAISYDGYTFTAVNDGKPVIGGDSIAAQRGIRDPHICRAPNGWFYIAMTDLHVFGKQKGLRTTQWERDDKYGWGNNRGLVLMKSKDLIHWTHTEVFVNEAFPENFSELGCAWAPQTVWDPAVGKPMVYFTIRQKPGGRTKMYYSYANEDFTKLETEPKLLFEYPDNKIQVLDADVLVLELLRGLFRLHQQLVKPLGGVEAAAGALYFGELIELRFDAAGEGSCVLAHVVDQFGNEAAVLLQQGEVQMFAVDLLVAQPDGVVLGLLDGLLCFHGQFVNVHCCLFPP
jgi:hypothetical protein